MAGPNARGVARGHEARRKAAERARFERDVPDSCRDCGTAITVPGNRALGISRCNGCDLEAM